MTHRRFQLHRDHDVTGVSGTGVVAEGVAFTGGVVALRWCSDWPTSVVFHDRGLEAVEAVHGHSGATRIVWLDDEEHGFDDASVLNPATGRPYPSGPLWAGTEPMDRPDPFCLCGAAWVDGRCLFETVTDQNAGARG